MPRNKAACRQRNNPRTAVFKPKARVGGVGGSRKLPPTHTLPIGSAPVVAAALTGLSPRTGALLQGSAGKRPWALRGLTAQRDVDLAMAVCAHTQPHACG